MHSYIKLEICSVVMDFNSGDLSIARGSVLCGGYWLLKKAPVEIVSNHCELVNGAFSIYNPFGLNSRLVS